MSQEKQPTLQRQLLLGIFVVSGFSGLIYESIWSHYLKLFLGHAAYAQTLVLMIFMGGMALGSILWGQVATHIGIPLTLTLAAGGLATGIAATWRFRLGAARSAVTTSRSVS